jgi:hypothetical protein
MLGGNGLGDGCGATYVLGAWGDGLRMGGVWLYKLTALFELSVMGKREEVGHCPSFAVDWAR